MSKKKKKHRGHYCYICQGNLPNEKFSGKGHKNHICKKCSQLSKIERAEIAETNKIYNLYGFFHLSKQNRTYLEGLSMDSNEKIRTAAKNVLESFDKKRINNCIDEFDDGFDDGFYDEFSYGINETFEDKIDDKDELPF